jgi:class 3 adenylate cyclase
MRLAEGLDPEEWHKTLDRFFKVLNDGAQAFEGAVNQFMATVSWLSLGSADCA